MILLTLLAVFCSLSLITLGASLSALYYVAFKMLEHDNESTIRNFFHSFWQNLIQGIGISLLLLGFGGMLFFDVQFMMRLTFSAGQAGNAGLPFPVLCGGWVICVLLAVLLLFFLLYLLPFQARFFNPLPVTVKNALAAGVRYLPKTLQLALCDGAACFLLVMCFRYFTGIVIVPLLLAPSFLAYYHAWVLKDILGLTPGQKDLPVEDPK